jgi:hypothetical protein
MSVAIYPESLGVPHVVSVIEAVVTVPLTDLAANTIKHGVITVRIARRFVRNHFILALAPDEQIVFANAVARRKTQSAQAPTNRLRPVASWTGEVVKIIVMHPQTPRDLAAGTGYIEHLAQRGLVPQFIPINLHVVAADVHIRYIGTGRNRQLDDIARQSSMVRAAAHADRGGVGKFESLNRDISRAAIETETVCPSDLSPADRFRADENRVRRRPGPADPNRRTRHIHPVGNDNLIARHGAVNPTGQRRKRSHVIGRRRGS